MMLDCMHDGRKWQQIQEAQKSLQFLFDTHATNSFINNNVYFS